MNFHSRRLLFHSNMSSLHASFSAYLFQQWLILGNTSAGGHKPTVSQGSLGKVISARTLIEKLWITGYFLFKEILNIEGFLKKCMYWHKNDVRLIFLALCYCNFIHKQRAKNPNKVNQFRSWILHGFKILFKKRQKDNYCTIRE